MIEQATLNYDINSANLPELVQANEDEGIGILVSMAKAGKIDPWNVDIVEVTDKYLKRSGMDYWKDLEVYYYENLKEFLNDERFIGVKHTSNDYFALEQVHSFPKNLQAWLELLK